MDVGGDVVHVNLRTGRGDIECAVGVLRAAGQPEFQTFLIFDSLLGALDRYGVGKVDLQIVAATVGQSGGVSVTLVSVFGRLTFTVYGA